MNGNPNSGTSYQIVLVDFGKACLGEKLLLNAVEQDEYFAKFPHIAPEVIKGESRQTTLSDVSCWMHFVSSSTESRKFFYSTPFNGTSKYYW